MAAFAISRAYEAASGANLKKLFGAGRVEQPKWFRLAIAAAAAGISSARSTALVVERAIHPVTIERTLRGGGTEERDRRGR